MIPSRPITASMRTVPEMRAILAGCGYTGVTWRTIFAA
jgi:hypothetical protein